MVGFNYRCIPALALARELIADGRIGAVREVRAAYLQDWLVDESAPMSWRLRKERGRAPGALGDLGSHVVDQLRFLLDDEIAWATGHLAHVRAHPARRVRPRAVTVDDAAWATARAVAVAPWPASR